jgi:hypothetical protein
MGPQPLSMDDERSQHCRKMLSMAAVAPRKHRPAKGLIKSKGKGSQLELWTIRNRMHV